MSKTISKKVKGAIAAIAGGVLLLGTGATFALWEDSTEIPGAAIVAGELSVDATAIDWTYSTVEWVPGEDIVTPEEWGSRCTRYPLASDCKFREGVRYMLVGTPGFLLGGGYFHYTPGTTVPGEGHWAPGNPVSMDPGSYRMIPGHTVMGQFTVTPHLIGNGLVADLTIKGEAASGFSPDVKITWFIDGVETNSIDLAAEYLGLTPTDPDKEIVIQVVITMPLDPAGGVNDDNNAEKFQDGTARWDLNDIQIVLKQQGPAQT